MSVHGGIHERALRQQQEYAGAELNAARSGPVWFGGSAAP
jgi:hypothetical protein